LRSTTLSAAAQFFGDVHSAVIAALAQAISLGMAQPRRRMPG